MNKKILLTILLPLFILHLIAQDDFPSTHNLTNDTTTNKNLPSNFKAHGGEISVNTKEGEFTEFVIQLPI